MTNLTPLISSADAHLVSAERYLDNLAHEAAMPIPQTFELGLAAGHVNVAIGLLRRVSQELAGDGSALYQTTQAPTGVEEVTECPNQ